MADSGAEASGDDLAQLEKDLLAAVDGAENLNALEEVRVSALGKKGRVSELMKGLGKMAPEERKTFGQAVNAVKQKVNDALGARKEALASAALAEKLASETADITLPVRRGPLQEGRIHPVSQVIDEIVEIFASMGFDIAEGPEIETDENNFTKLNIPPEHPARQEQDTFYLPEDKDGNRKVLRTHTSAVQIRAMEAGEPPFRLVAPGRVYRSDYDQTHTPQFHQVEGLVVDKDIHFGHLKWVLEEFFKAFFEIDDVRVRFRANYFPFTEPSMEADIGAEFLGGGEDSWLEIMGCGMVHPNVLRNVNVDPAKYQGFAFGIGIDRLTMLKYGLPDLRDFFGGDQRWLKHYGIAPLSVPTVAGGLSG